ncbi:MAG: signal transduction histidine kinase [Planctomycetota bacterium]
MSLRRKVALVLSLAVASLFLIDHLLHGQTFAPRFERDADVMAKNEIEHIIELIKGEVEILGEGAVRLTSVLEGKRLEEVQGLDFLTQAGGLDVLLIFDEEGYVKFHRVLDPISHEPLKLGAFPNERLSEFNLLRCSLRSRGVAGLKRVEEGVITTARGTVLIASRTARLAGGEKVQVAAGRFLSGRWLKHFKGNGKQIQMHQLMRDSQTAEVQTLVDLFAHSPSNQVIERKDDSLVAWGILYDLGGNPACLIGQEVDSPLAAIWDDLRAYSKLSFLALAVLCPLVLLMLLQFMVTGPLGQLVVHSKIIARDSTTEKRLVMGRNDEIGQLADEFDSMLDQLAISRSDVIQLARKAGASDVATGVLHNVGNSLNSVGVLVRLANEKLDKLPLEDLDLISLVLQSNHSDLDTYLTEDERGRTLPAYVEALNQSMKDQVNQLGGELSELLQGVSGIEELVTSLEPSGGSGNLLERLDLAVQLDSILEISAVSLEGMQSVQVVRDYAAGGKIEVDRHKFSEVMLHLLRSCILQAEKLQELEVVVAMRPDSSGGLAVTVSDNGPGLASEELARVFAMDTSIGHRDGSMGLHLASTSAIEMGAKLTAHSAGLGLGACYRLVLPAKSLAA